jgi:hypothetical protein
VERRWKEGETKHGAKLVPQDTEERTRGLWRLQGVEVAPVRALDATELLRRAGGRRQNGGKLGWAGWGVGLHPWATGKLFCFLFYFLF